MNNKTKVLSLIVFVISLFTITSAQARTDYEKKVIQDYETKCIKESRFVLDAAKALCQCVSSELLKKNTILDLSKLSQPMVELSEEEAAKVENVDEDMYTLRDLEFKIAEICVKKTKNKKKKLSQ